MLLLLILVTHLTFVKVVDNVNQNIAVVDQINRCGDEWPLPKHRDPETYLSVPKIINYRGFPSEIHRVVTQDGYILTLHRIPRKHNRQSNNKLPVLLVHGLLDSSFTWINNFANQSLAYVLWRQGYDVWLANVRGNTYSRDHIKLKPSQKEFWQFTLDDMATYDIPTTINYIISNTNKPQLFYVGHSQGTTIAMANWNQKFPRSTSHLIRAAAFLAPVATITYIKSPIRLIAPFAQSIAEAVELFGSGEFMPSSKLIKFFSVNMCSTKLSELCSSAIFLLCGFDCKYTNFTRLPVYLTQTPAGTSAMNMVHYAQIHMTKRFQKYDFGPIENLIRYGQLSPPEYNIANIKVPLAMYHATNDWLASPRDYQAMRDKLAHTIYRDRLIPDYNHLDFVWAYNAVDKVYGDIIDFFHRAKVNLK